MKKGLLTALIYLMALIIVGLIGIQYFFIKVSYEEKKQIYDQNIYSALQNATSRLNNRQSVMFIYNKLNRDKTDSIKPVDPNFFSFTYPDGTNINFEFNMQKRPDQYINDELSSDYAYKKNKKHSPENYFSHMLKHDKSKLYKMINNLESELMLRNLPLEKLYTKKSIKNVLKEELKNKGISQNFNFAVIHNNKHIHPHLKSDDFSANDIYDAYKINLRPNAIFKKPDYLAVTIPEQNKFLLDSISLQITLSIVFVMLILIAFFISTYVIFRQRKLSEIKSDFISNMTHEFKTPIATIRLAADSLLNPKTVNNKKLKDQFTGIISQETKRLNSQVEKVLEISTMDKGKLKLNLKKQDIHEILKEAVDNQELNINKTNAEIILKLEAYDYIYSVDKEHMVNVINNLIDNSIKYAGKNKPKIELKTYNKNKWIYISVKDNGIGMNSATLSKIFDKFYRADGGNIHNVKGFGLGLHYVKEIINAHKGLIDVKSTPGKGSTFVIKLLK